MLFVILVIFYIFHVLIEEMVPVLVILLKQPWSWIRPLSEPPELLTHSMNGYWQPTHHHPSLRSLETIKMVSFFLYFSELTHLWLHPPSLIQLPTAVRCRHLNASLVKPQNKWKSASMLKLLMIILHTPPISTTTTHSPTPASPQITVFPLSIYLPSKDSQHLTVQLHTGSN